MAAVEYREEARVLWAKFNRPQALNAINRDFVELKEVVEYARRG